VKVHDRSLFSYHISDGESTLSRAVVLKPANKQQHSRFQSPEPRVTVQAGWKPNIAKQKRKKERKRKRKCCRPARPARKIQTSNPNPNPNGDRIHTGMTMQKSPSRKLADLSFKTDVSFGPS
jgi:hypothetical protein